MGLSLKKLVRKAGRFVKKRAGTIALTALAGAPGLAAGAVRGFVARKALSVAKSMGRKRAGRVTVKSIVPALKLASIDQLGPRVPTTLPISMPGGAPLARVRKSRRRAPRAAPAAAGAPKKGRKPPTGGLDLKRIAAQWRAEGKPGKWIDYVKAHR